MTKDEAKKIHKKMNVLFKKGNQICFGARVIAEDAGNFTIDLPMYGTCMIETSNSVVGLQPGDELLIFQPIAAVDAAVVLEYFPAEQ